MARIPRRALPVNDFYRSEVIARSAMDAFA
jgi:hypothetical protein